MKKIAFLTVAILALLPGSAFSQAQAFRNFIIAANSPTNPKGGKDAFQALGGEERFELPTWGKGWAISRGDEVIRDGFLFNLDHESNDLYVRDESTAQDVVVDKNSVRRFALFNGTDTVYFVKNIAVDPQNKTFYQLLGGDPQGAVVLLKHRLAKLIPVDKNDYMRNFNGDYAPHYQSKFTYYVVDAKSGVHAYNNLGKKELLALYPDRQELLNAFFAEHKRPDDRALHTLFDSLNAL
jgi:hypothetical protein